MATLMERKVVNIILCHTTLLSVPNILRCLYNSVKIKYFSRNFSSKDLQIDSNVIESLSVSHPETAESVTEICRISLNSFKQNFVYNIKPQQYPQ